MKHEVDTRPSSVQKLMQILLGRITHFTYRCLACSTREAKMTPPPRPQEQAGLSFNIIHWSLLGHFDVPRGREAQAQESHLGVLALPKCGLRAC